MEKQIVKLDVRKELWPGRLIVHTVTGHTGEIHRVYPTWLTVFNCNMSRNLHEWSINQVSFRMPRLIKRYPRPLRWPRMAPTILCHCRVGRMEVHGGERLVVCTRCRFPIGTESFPNRIKKAVELLRKEIPNLVSWADFCRRLPRPSPRTPHRRGGKNSAHSRQETKKVSDKLGVRRSRDPTKTVQKIRREKATNKISKTARRKVG